VISQKSFAPFNSVPLAMIADFEGIRGGHGDAPGGGSIVV
jgi:hypothetical protein